MLSLTKHRLVSAYDCGAFRLRLCGTVGMVPEVTDPLLPRKCCLEVDRLHVLRDIREIVVVAHAGSDTVAGADHVRLPLGHRGPGPVEQNPVFVTVVVVAIEVGRLGVRYRIARVMRVRAARDGEETGAPTLFPPMATHPDQRRRCQDLDNYQFVRSCAQVQLRAAFDLHAATRDRHAAAPFGDDDLLFGPDPLERVPRAGVNLDDLKIGQLAPGGRETYTAFEDGHAPFLFALSRDAGTRHALAERALHNENTTITGATTTDAAIGSCYRAVYNLVNMHNRSATVYVLASVKERNGPSTPSQTTWPETIATVISAG